MNLERVLKEYPGFDVRRIDLVIGEKALWGQGLGTEVIQLLMDYAFQQLGVDYLYEPDIADYNIRSQRAFEKNDHRVVARNLEPPGMKASYRVDLLAKNPRNG
jgi:RimJ/RimL family protein N-acetyltransferase